MDLASILTALRQGDHAVVARAISLVENDTDLGRQLLTQLPMGTIPVVGFTGPPGAGKSSLVDALLQHLIAANKKIAVLAVDPSSPLGSGSLLGDRIRMARHATHPHVFIRSMSSRGALGGLSEKTMEAIDVLQQAPFDYIFIETVGTGQSERDIVLMADVTVLVLTPSAGDEVQAMKSGILDVADILVVNKADLPGADHFANMLRQFAAHRSRTTDQSWRPPDADVPVTQTVAVRNEGADGLLQLILQRLRSDHIQTKRRVLRAEKLRRIIASECMKRIPLDLLTRAIDQAGDSGNLYVLAHQYLAQHGLK